MPASTRSRSFSGVAVAGPRVQTIFARRLTSEEPRPDRCTDTANRARIFDVSLRVLPFVTAALLSVVILFMPRSGVPSAPFGVDKIVHIGLFGLLAVTGLYARLRLFPLAVALVLYAVASEILQATLPIDRSFEVVDIITDWVGLAAGTLLHAWATSARGRRQRARYLRRAADEDS
ncbi:VanZ family protein [Allokutzneria sp. NRRL B-24872]|uniref:VanZ family protein n=1 Tax=Allokutzneria sp. NRRL B-24872 TaxID=1137961 RepID=UPI000A365018